MSRKDSKFKAQQTRDAYAKNSHLRARRAGITEPVIVDAIPNDPDGLMPVSVLPTGIRIQVQDWRGGAEMPDFTEQLVIEWKFAVETDDRYKPLLRQTFTTPLGEIFPIQLTIPPAEIDGREGRFDFRYGVQVWSDASFAYSLPVPVTLDRTPPWGAASPEAIVALPLVTSDTLTSDNGVRFTIPSFIDDKKEFTHVAIGWLKVPQDPDQPFLPDLDLILPADQEVVIPRITVEQLGSGDHYVVYTLRDKAGNTSRVSRVRTVPVALGLLPAGLKKPVVPLAVDGVVDLLDAHAGVGVEIPLYDNHDPRDTVIVKWGASSVLPVPVGEQPTDPLSIPIAWQYLDAEYNLAIGRQATPVSYSVVRGTTSFLLDPNDEIMVDVDFSTTGPINPGNPDPVNPVLGVVTVTGDSGNENHLIDTDAGLPASITVPLYTPLTVGDEITVHWNGVAIANTYTVTGLEVNAFTLEVTWAEILAGKPGPEVPVYFTLSNPAFENDQRSGSTLVNVEAISITLAEVIYVDAYKPNATTLILNCSALRKNGNDIGYRVHIPPSEHLIPGETVTVEWKLETAGGVSIPGSEKKEVLTITAQSAVNGIAWHLKPYDDVILPSYSTSETWAYGITTYTLEINGVPVTSSPASAIVAISNIAQGHDTCDLSVVVAFP